MTVVEAERESESVVRRLKAQSAIRDACGRLRQGFPGGFSSMQDILRWIRNHDIYAVYSFDIFDTLLRRRVDPPEEIKRLVAQHISERLAGSGIQCHADDVLAERNKVEAVLRQDAASKGADAGSCLNDIMAGTLRSIGAGDVLKWQDIVDYELALERTATEPMPDARALLTYLRSNQKRIVAVSETYFSETQIASMLKHHDLLRYVDALYVSCDVRKSKLTGNLFRHVLEKEKGRLVHIGDDYTFDYRIPRKLGVKALWFRSAEERRRRRGLRGLAAGKNRLAYVNAIVGRADRQQSDLFRIGHDVLGPALTIFMHCVAERAKSDGIHRIFFVARDGFLLKRVYQTLQNNVYTDGSLPPAKYLCLSRLAVRRASIGARGLSEADVREVLRYMAARKKHVTVADVLGSYGLEPSSLAHLITRHGLDVGMTVTNAVDHRIQALLEDEDFRTAIASQGSVAKQLLRSYLKESGFIGSHRTALVDATSEGLTQALLRAVFADDRDYPEVYGYYFTLLNLGVDNPGISRDISTAWGIVNDWRTDPRASQGIFGRFGLFVELFSHPNHGVTVGYRRTNGRIAPTFRRTSQESQYPLTSQGLEGALVYARTYATCYELHNHDCQDLVKDVKGEIRQWVRSPSREHSSALHGLFVTSDWPTETRHPLLQEGIHLPPTALVNALLRRRPR